MSNTTPLWKTFLVFLAPMMLSNILQSLFGTINNVYLGQMIGVDALAAVSVFFPVMFFFIAFVMGLSSGATVLIGQAWGAGEPRQGEGGRRHDADGRAALVGHDRDVRRPVQPAAPDRARHAADILDAASAYARIMMITMPLTFVFILMTAMMRGVGDTVTPLLALAISTVVGSRDDAGPDPRLVRPAAARRRQRRLGVGDIRPAHAALARRPSAPAQASARHRRGISARTCG